MTETHWDPGNLLQLIEPDKPSEVQCVGRARRRYDSRCQWTLDDSDAKAVLSRIKELAETPPSRVTFHDLESLARLCLCRKFHSGQWSEVAQRWKLVLAQATRHYEQSAARNGAPNNVQLESLLSERLRCLQILGIEGGEVDLPGKLLEYSKSSARGDGRIETATRQAQLELAVARDDLAAAHARLVDLEEELAFMKRRESDREEEHQLTVSRLEETLKSKLSRLAELQENEKEDMKRRLSEATAKAALWVKEEKAKRKALEQEKEDLERQLSKAKATTKTSTAKADTLSQSNERLSRKNAAVRARIRSLEADVEDLKNQVKQLEAKRSSLERELKQSLVQSKTLCTANDQLKAQNSALRDQIIELSKPWRHRLRAWFGKRHNKPHHTSYHLSHSSPSSVLSVTPLPPRSPTR
ncbi:hypothetical protein VTI74DRAFT_3758 [Chaetomium olivicolor]